MYRGNYQTRERMEGKLADLGESLPENLNAATVLDVGCESGFWCRLAEERGAKHVTGIDRGRHIKGRWVDLVTQNDALDAGRSIAYKRVDLGSQWPRFEPHDVVLCFSVYHHILRNCEDHNSIWFWLWLHTRERLLWEGALDDSDPVVQQWVRQPYRRDDILAAARTYFDVEEVGPSRTTKRTFLFCRPKAIPPDSYFARAVSGAGGATKAFCARGEQRIEALREITGVRPIPGSLNLKLARDFAWDRHYLRCWLEDVVDRRLGLDSEWAPRWLRLYPCAVDGMQAHLFRFEGEKYPASFAEAVSHIHLRSGLSNASAVALACPV